MNGNSLVIRYLRSAVGKRLGGAGTVVLSYIGPVSGRRIELPVWAVPSGGRWLVGVGMAEKKVWYKSFRTPLAATITDRGREHDVVGRLAASEEVPAARAAIVARRRSADRMLAADPPVVVLTPADP